jgi:hypothetical protein
MDSKWPRSCKGAEVENDNFSSTVLTVYITSQNEQLASLKYTAAVALAEKNGLEEAELNRVNTLPRQVCTPVMINGTDLTNVSDYSALLAQSR